MIERNFVLGEKVYFDFLARNIITPDRAISLGSREAKILKLMLKKSNKVISKDLIFDNVWGKVLVSEASLTKAISNLRKSLDSIDQLDCQIKTVPKEGYILILDEVEELLHFEEENTPTLAIKHIINHEKTIMHSFHSKHISKPTFCNQIIKGSLWFSTLFFISLLAAFLNSGMLLFFLHLY
ncbi:winged helix-turn-helix domain-containing protein [Photobacterium leiognathi]|uniref:winged helix-turn-helix domain-containing protein n=1 Tax=Photobacterium leiognathi TaxID=553611 RepID=UPI002981FD90|nr:winged helix-turn-helix domain-containing protein [Photobacterium leiognathi]